MPNYTYMYDGSKQCLLLYDMLNIALVYNSSNYCAYVLLGCMGVCGWLWIWVCVLCAMDVCDVYSTCCKIIIKYLLQIYQFFYCW